MENNLLKTMINKINDSIRKGGDKLEKDCDELSNKISEVLQSENNKIIFVAVGGTSKLINGLNYDVKYNLGIEENKIIVLNPGESFKDYIANWESMGALRSIAPIELENIGLEVGDLVIGVSSSGDNEFVQGAINFANDLGCTTSLITNNAKSLENDNADITILLEFEDYIIDELRSFEGSTSLKFVVDSLIMKAAVLSGRIYNQKLVYKKWNSEYTRQQCVKIVMDILNISLEEAEDIFTKSGGVQSIAIIMYDRKWDKEKAHKFLKDNKFNFNNITLNTKEKE